MSNKTSLKNRLGQFDAKANEILKQELKDKWNEITYEEIRRHAFFSGLQACSSIRLGNSSPLEYKHPVYS